MPTAKLEYQTDNELFNEETNPAEYYTPHPFALFMPIEIALSNWRTATRMLDLISGKNGSLIMMALTLGVLALIIFEGFRTYQRIMKRKTITAQT